MNKVKLSADDKTRLIELVKAYVNPSDPFKVNNKGEVSMNKNSWLIRKFRSEEDNKLDFLEVSQMILDKIMDAKENIPYIVQLCRTGIMELMNNNNRSETIKKMYMAHLTTEQPEQSHPQQQQQQQQKSRQPVGQEVTIRTQQRQRHDQTMNITPFSRNKALAEDVAELMNEANIVQIYEPIN